MHFRTIGRLRFAYNALIYWVLSVHPKEHIGPLSPVELLYYWYLIDLKWINIFKKNG